jgi:hypothetical protein
MTIFIGVFIVALVLFMVFAMAMAEWADKDAGDLIAAWFRRKTPAAGPVPAPAPAKTAATSVPPAPARRISRPAVKSKTAKSSGGKRKRK